MSVWRVWSSSTHAAGRQCRPPRTADLRMAARTDLLEQSPVIGLSARPHPSIARSRPMAIKIQRPSIAPDAPLIMLSPSYVLRHLSRLLKVSLHHLPFPLG